MCPLLWVHYIAVWRSGRITGRNVFWKEAWCIEAKDLDSEGECLGDGDIFKSVNDTYGHATGDAILKKVSSLLKSAFRSVDYVCRIGGDEFAIVLVEMTSDLKYTIQEKITAVNQELSEPTDGLPAVSLSVGVAFSDRENPGESIFKDADKALYQIKEHGKHGCGFYGEKETEE